jgi:hypothetical protein
MARFARVVPPILAAGLAVAIFALDRGNHPVAIALLLIAGLLSLVVMLLGKWAVCHRPRIGTWLIDCGYLGILVGNAVAALLFAVLGVWVGEQLLQGPTSTSTTEIAKTVSGAFGLALAAAVTSIFAHDEDTRIWPSGVFRTTISTCYANRFSNSSCEHDAVYETRINRTCNNESVVIEGWGFRARHKRARLLPRRASHSANP